MNGCLNLKPVMLDIKLTGKHPHCMAVCLLYSSSTDCFVTEMLLEFKRINQ
jgi:hypothetical protein